MDDLDLRMLAIDLADGNVFTNCHLDNPDQIASHFIPLGLGAFDKKTKKEISDIGMIYEYNNKALPMACNGKPMFISFSYLNKEDTLKLHAYYKEIKALKEKFKNGPTPEP